MIPGMSILSSTLSTSLETFGMAGLFYVRVVRYLPVSPSEGLPDVNTEIDNMKQTVVKVSRLLTRSFIC